MEDEINTTIILTKNNMDHGIIGNCQECPLALAINRYLKQGYFAVIFYTQYSIQYWDEHQIINMGPFDMPGEAYLIVSAIDRGEKIETPCKVKIPLPKEALRPKRQTPRILPLP